MLTLHLCRPFSRWKPVLFDCRGYCFWRGWFWFRVRVFGFLCLGSGGRFCRWFGISRPPIGLLTLSHATFKAYRGLATDSQSHVQGSAYLPWWWFSPHWVSDTWQLRLWSVGLAPWWSVHWFPQDPTSPQPTSTTTTSKSPTNSSASYSSTTPPPTPTSPTPSTNSYPSTPKAAPLFSTGLLYYRFSAVRVLLLARFWSQVLLLVALFLAGFFTWRYLGRRRGRSHWSLLCGGG